MDDQQQVTIPDPAGIRKQMEETRSSLTEKLEVLEQKVSNTVEEARMAVEDTVSTVKETVESSVETVKDTLNLSRHVERHPWGMVGGSVALGFLGGWLLGRPAKSSHPSAAPTIVGPPLKVQEPPAPLTTPHQPVRGEEPTLLDQMAAALAPELGKLKGLAIGTLGAVVRDLVSEATPENLRPQVTGVINDLTTRVGGDLIPGRILPESSKEEPENGPNSIRSRVA